MAQPQPGMPGFVEPKVRLGELIHKVVDNTNEELNTLVKGRNMGDDSRRKEAILKWMESAHRRFLHLYVLQKWSQSGLDTVKQCDKLEDFLKQQKISMAECQDAFYFVMAGGGLENKKGLLAMRERQWDIPTAVDVLADRSVNRLPRGMVPPGPNNELETWDKETTISRLEDAIRFRLLDTQQAPHQFTSMSLQGGVLTARVEGEFELQLTLQSPVPNHDWTVLRVGVMVGARASGAGGGEGSTAAALRRGVGLAGGPEEEVGDEERRLIYAGLPSPTKHQLAMLRDTVQQAVIGEARALRMAFRVVRDFCCSLVVQSEQSR